MLKLRFMLKQILPARTVTSYKNLNVKVGLEGLVFCISFSREWKDGVLTVLLRRQVQQLRLQETDKKTIGKPLMKWLHLDGTVTWHCMSIKSDVDDCFPKQAWFISMLEEKYRSQGNWNPCKKKTWNDHAFKWCHWFLYILKLFGCLIIVKKITWLPLNFFLD